MNEKIQRQTAYRIWIKNILSSEFKKEEGEFRPQYITLRNINIARVNIIATVIQTIRNDEKQYTSITVDDTSAQIRIKTWNESTELLKDIEISDTVLLIARIREYNNERYLVPEIIKKVDPLWELKRRLELLREIKSEGIEINENIHEQMIEESSLSSVTEERMQHKDMKESSKLKIIKSIEKLDTEQGANILDVIKEADINREEADRIIESLIKEGEIYQIGQGRLKTT